MTREVIVAKGKLLPAREKNVLKACMALLHLRGVFCWRNNTAAFGATHKGVRRFVRCGLPGASDILGVLPDGRFLAVEVKRPGGKPSEAQAAFMRAINASKGAAFWTSDAAHMDLVLGHILNGARVHVGDDSSIHLTNRWEDR